MSYQQIDYEPSSLKLSGEAKTLVDAAEERFRKFYAKGLNKRYSRYIASEPEQVYAAIKWVIDNGIAPGKRFVEWGSGFGVATGLAATLNCEASGIELRKGLVEIAEELLESQSIDADILCTSYIPEGFITYETAGGKDIVADNSFGHDAGEACYRSGASEIYLDEVDLFFVYPWPGEQEMMLKLFDAIAAADAILITYFGDMDISIYRKM